jgi:hypothetical protein
MTGRDVLYMLAALAALLLAMAAPPSSSPCHESPRGDWACNPSQAAGPKQNCAA